MTTLLPLLTKQVKSCILCNIGKASNRRIIFRGSSPCNILFVGEAAGDMEKVLGEPFVGPAGKLLDSIIEEALPGISCGFTNSVYCVPTDPVTRRIRVPKNEEIKNCSSHLEYLASTVKAKAIVAVGNSGDKAIKKVKLNESLHYVKIIHPSAIIRQQEEGELDLQRTIYILKELAKCLKRNPRRKP